MKTGWRTYSAKALGSGSRLCRRFKPSHPRSGTDIHRQISRHWVVFAFHVLLLSALAVCSTPSHAQSPNDLLWTQDATGPNDDLYEWQLWSTSTREYCYGGSDAQYGWPETTAGSRGASCERAAIETANAQNRTKQPDWPDVSCRGTVIAVPWPQGRTNHQCQLVCDRWYPVYGGPVNAVVSFANHEWTNVNGMCKARQWPGPPTISVTGTPPVKDPARPGEKRSLVTTSVTYDRLLRAGTRLSLHVQSTVAGEQPATISPTVGLTGNNGQLVSTLVTQASQKRQTYTVMAVADDFFPGISPAATWEVTIEPDPIVIGFFNGVANTQEAALDSLDRLEEEFGPQYKESPLKHSLFYNQTACRQEDGLLDKVLGKAGCLEDLAEVFSQRTLEQFDVFGNRWETFWDILAGRHKTETSFTGRLLSLLGNGSNALLQWLDTSASALLNELAYGTFKLLSLFGESTNYADRTAHREKLSHYANEGNRLLLVAHSQGNLFVNKAHDWVKLAHAETPIQVVHVAPASPTLRGAYVLADIDLVINGVLRLTGLNSVPVANINLPLSKQDPTGHGFEPTYLDKARAAYSRTMGMINTSLEALTP